MKAVQGTTGHASADMLVNTYAHIQQTSRKELGQKFEESFYKEAVSPLNHLRQLERPPSPCPPFWTC